MGRQLKHHERKLLKKVDFLDWKQDQGHRDAQVMRMYHVQNRSDYEKYNRICGQIRQLAHRLTQLPAQDKVRMQYQEMLVDKLENLGVFGHNMTPKASDLEKLSVAAFCRRRLPVVMARIHMAPNVSDATKFVEQGHVRVGPQLVTDPAMLITPDMEDFVTWADGSKIRRKIREYKNTVDDYELL